jgi:galactokinase
MDLRQRTIDAFRERFGANPDFTACAPGRVNLLGEHVDYNDGFVLPAAIDRSTCIAFRKAPDAASTILALDLGHETSFTVASIPEKKAADGAALPSWGLYPCGVMWSLGKAGLTTPSMQAVFSSNVPRGAGLSSSASVEVGYAFAWGQLGGWKIPCMELAQLAQRAEVDYVGVNSGIMDQFASACGVRHSALCLDCRSLEWEPVTIPPGISIVIADTTIRRSLAGSAYNDRHDACIEAVHLLKTVLPGIQSLRDVSLQVFNENASLLSPLIEKRARHVVEEIARTSLGVKYLQEGDVTGFGLLMDQCHASLRDLYEVSSPELDAMVETAQSIPGCLGARLTGAGFGGCTVNLVENGSEEAFTSQLANGYWSRTRLQPEIYICQASDGAVVEPVQ